MKSAVLLLLLAAAVASTSGNIIENSIYRYLQQFRLDMECGFPQSGIPVLAPLRHARLPVNINLNEFAFQGNLINFFSGDLNTFVVRNVGFNMVFMRMDFHFHFPSLTTTGQFGQAVGRSPGNCAIHGGGSFAVRSNQVDYHMTSRLVLRGGTLELGEMTSRITMGSFQSNVQSFVGTQQQNAQCNLALQQQMPRIFASQQPQINRYMENLFRPVADGFVSGMTLQDLLNVISQSGPPQPCRRMAAAAAETEVEVEADEQLERGDVVEAVTV